MTSASAESVRDLIVTTLDERKGADIVALDVRGRSNVTDWMIIATGMSNRHLRALAEDCVDALKKLEHPPLGIEGGRDSNWVLLDVGVALVHLMTEETRGLYQLERLWGEPVIAAS